MELSPLVSVLVVSYNHSAYINECLDSIKNQTYSNIELIVADDFSRDNSVDVYNTWISDNNYEAKCVFNERNIGLANTLNNCIKLLKGKYVKIIAADDFLHPDSIVECVHFLESNSSDYGMVFTNVFYVNASSELVDSVTDFDTLGMIPAVKFSQELLKGNRIAALSVLMRVDVLIETGDYDEGVLAEDYHRWLLITQKYFIGYLPKKLAYYRSHPTNISKLKADLILEDALILQMQFDKHGYVKEYIDKAMYELLLGNSVTPRLKENYLNYPHGSRKVKICCKYVVMRVLMRVNHFLKTK